MCATTGLRKLRDGPQRNLHFKGAWHHIKNGRNEIPKYISVGVSSLPTIIFYVKC